MFTRDDIEAGMLLVGGDNCVYTVVPTVAGLTFQDEDGDWMPIQSYTQDMKAVNPDPEFDIQAVYGLANNGHAEYTFERRGRELLYAREVDSL